MFLALGLLLPFVTGQIPQIGKMLLPMHIPVLLCGLICGEKYGLAVGFLTPLLRSVLFSMPIFYPTAIAMAFELAVYGFMAGLLYKILPKKTINIYVSLIGAMVVGRIVWGLVMFCILGFDISKFGLVSFWAGAVANAIPGIIVQIILIPIIVMLLEKSKLISREK